MPLFIGRPRSLKAVETALLQDKKVFVVAQANSEVEDPGPEDLHQVGVLCNLL
ncbi:MAG: LON peptidase substrate-binding domain-containing protein, partial [Fretibacterium sp.]|nr:LON peptidase substrate-binding domain-containing protein [Fretibacterium sp.]